MKQAQPRLYDYAYTLRQKSQVDGLLDVSSHKPLLHAASIYPASRACLAVIMPLVAHPTDKNAVLTYDLSVDPAPWLTASVEELRAALFTPAQERAVDEVRLPVTVIHINRCPMLAPMSALPAERMPALMLDLAAIRRHWHTLMQHPEFFHRVAQAMVSERTPDPAPDVDFMLYSGGFFADADKRLMARWRQADAAQLRDYQQHAMAEARDGRLPEMLLRYRARNFAGSLTMDEHQHWLALCRSRLGLTHGDAEMPAENAPPELIAGVAPAGTTVQQCLSEITSLRAQSDVTSRDLQVLNDLEQWVRAVCLHLAK